MSAVSNVEEVSLIVRILVDRKRCGGIIGKGGATISQIRSESGVHVEVGEHVRGAFHRIVTVRGMFDGVLKAVLMITDTMITTATSSEASEEEQQKIVLLVCNAQIGAIIGHAGVTVNALRKETSANIKVSEKVLGRSNEKTVTVSGERQNMHNALSKILAILFEHSSKYTGDNLYWPTPSYAYLRHMYGDFSAHNSAQMQQSQRFPNAMMSQGGQFTHHQQEHQMGPQPGQHFKRYTGASQIDMPTKGDVENIIIPIPETLIGYLIGRKGAAINNIRRRSGTSIKINDKATAKETSGNNQGVEERIISITGFRAANEIAVALINEKLSQYDPSEMMT